MHIFCLKGSDRIINKLRATQTTQNEHTISTINAEKANIRSQIIVLLTSICDVTVTLNEHIISLTITTTKNNKKKKVKKEGKEAT